MAQRWLWPVSVYLLTVLLWVSAFPPVNLPEAAYIFAVPFVLWAFWKPTLKRYLITAGLAGFTAWVILLFWLRHVTVLGVIALSAYLTLYIVSWLFAVWWAVPRLEGRGIGARLSALLGLAGWWVLLEYLRGFLFTGFSWLPLASSQWDRSALLQIISYTGYTGLSFVLIFFNLGLAVYLRRIVARRGGREWHERICYEFYVALLFLLVAASGLIWAKTFGQRQEALFRAAVVQPYIKQSLKWEPTKVLENFRTLRVQTLFASANGGEVVFWPESVTPLPIKGNAEALSWTESIASEIDKPILMGNMAIEGETWYNIVCAVTPEGGLVNPYYAKRRLVPFGEYVPFENLLPFIKKVVPLKGSFGKGTTAELIPLKIGESSYLVGALVCYEDIFPRFSREIAKGGADFVFVATNNAWYGEEGGAYQHAAHSVLRAVETRRPFIRCGNSGWSGWIDEYGNVRQILVRPDNGIYFRGSDIIKVSRDSRWKRRESFYVRYGDWFVGVCGLLTVMGYFGIRAREEGQYQVGELLRPPVRD